MSGAEVLASEGTVALLSGVRVGIGNIWERPFELPDGEERVGITAMLHVEDGDRVVAGPGSELLVGGARWRVLDVRAGHGRGSVTLAPAR